MSLPHPTIIPAILVNSEQKFLTQIKAVERVVSTIQLDIADGQFVPNTTWADPKIVGENLQIDCELHLMVQDPLKEARRWEGISQIKRVLVHYESDPGNAGDILTQIHSNGWEVGVVLNLETPIDVVDELVELIDVVQCMAIQTGFQKQPFVPKVLEKILALHTKYIAMPIAVDGHVNAETLPRLVRAGATRFGVGSAIFGNDFTPAQNVENLKRLCTG